MTMKRSVLTVMTTMITACISVRLFPKVQYGGAAVPAWAPSRTAISVLA